MPSGGEELLYTVSILGKELRGDETYEARPGGALSSNRINIQVDVTTVRVLNQRTESGRGGKCSYGKLA